MPARKDELNDEQNAKRERSRCTFPIGQSQLDVIHIQPSGASEFKTKRKFKKNLKLRKKRENLLSIIISLG